ncbi:MAG: Ppx/GppA family phosphatase [Lentimicrobium sp.]|jgi:exopolyphosphatase/guanosine-5'-triphosphate,3'-diphosphate pyrophosphatase|nr:Ppx/GppA family phosphatase [Lentimicrobium sp.]
MLLSGIDIGSNAVRLLFANVFSSKSGIISEKATLLRIPLRLGLDVFNIGKLSDKKTDELVKTMLAFKLLIEVYNPEAYRVAATSAMREASNQQQVIARVKAEAGLDINIINGIQEANIISSLSNVYINRDFTKTLYIDVGGGSTELSVIDENKLIASNSFKIGTLRLLADKVEQAEWENMRRWLQEFKSDFGRMNCIGSGGNINKLTKLYGHSSNNRIGFDELVYANKQLNAMPLKVRIESLGLRPDRADVIVPASRIFIRILKWTGLGEVISPRLGLADGLVLSLYKELIEAKSV